MPSEDLEDSYLYNQYTKTIKFDNEHTQDCIEGCYLLISIKAQYDEYIEDYNFYPFSIISKISNIDNPIINIGINEYIIGTVYYSENENIYQFYEIRLTHDSLRVNFDFQSDIAELYISVGGIRFTTKNSDFKLIPPMRESILYLDKFQIINKCMAKKIKLPHKDSIQDINLIIGIWTNKTDSIDNELFSLRISLPDEGILDIIEVNQDQKILCSPKRIDDAQYRCLFMVIYDEENLYFISSPLIIHASSVNQTAITYTYGNFINKFYYDEYDIDKLVELIPNFENTHYNTKEDDNDYIYIEFKKRDTYFYVNVISDKPDDIFILTSMNIYNNKYDNIELYPDPYSERLFFISKESLKLNFYFNYNQIINIVSLGGEGELIFGNNEKEIYNLKGRNNRLTLTSEEILDKITIKKNYL